MIHILIKRLLPLGSCIFGLLVLTGECLATPSVNDYTNDSSVGDLSGAQKYVHNTNNLPNCNQALQIGIAFPLTNTLDGLNFTIQQLKKLNIKKVRFDENWNYREPEQGEFVWEPLDKRINIFYDNNIDILLTINSTGPAWACQDQIDSDCTYKNPDDFKNYIEEVLKRHTNKIDKIQFGNEWEIYPFEAEKFVSYANILYDAVKKISPNTKVAIGGLTAKTPIYNRVCVEKKELDFSNLQLEAITASELNQQIENDFCVRRVAKYIAINQKVIDVLKDIKYDLFDIHLYDDAENWPIYLDFFKKLTNKPIIVSEVGVINPDYEIYSEDYHLQRFEKYLNIIQSLPIEEFYHFLLVDSDYTYHKKSGLMTLDKKEKKAYVFLADIMNEDCSINPPTTPEGTVPTLDKWGLLLLTLLLFRRLLKKGIAVKDVGRPM